MPQAESVKAQDEGIASFWSANVPDSDDALGIFNRVVRIQGDNLVVDQTVANDRMQTAFTGSSMFRGIGTDPRAA